MILFGFHKRSGQHDYSVAPTSSIERVTNVLVFMLLAIMVSLFKSLLGTDSLIILGTYVSLLVYSPKFD